MGEDFSNAIGIVNEFLNKLVNCGRGKWYYSTEDGMNTDMSGSYMGLWSSDFKVNLIHNMDEKSKLTVLDFGRARIISETEEMLTVNTKNGNIMLGHN